MRVSICMTANTAALCYVRNEAIVASFALSVTCPALQFKPRAPMGPTRPAAVDVLMSQQRRGGVHARIGRNSMSTAVGLIGLIGIITAAVLLWPQQAERRPRADPVNSEQVALGRVVYQQHCASCHGANLEGEPNWRRRKANGRLPAPPHDATGHTWEHTEEELFDVIQRGVQAIVSPTYETDMIGFADVLSNVEIWAVIAFIRSTWPPRIEEIRRRMDRANDRH